MTASETFISIQHASSINVAEHWRSQYQKDGRWLHTESVDREAVYNRLLALGPMPDIEKSAEIIGSKSWSFIKCDGCAEYVVIAVAIGEDEPKSYCGICIREAAAAMVGATAQ